MSAPQRYPLAWPIGRPRTPVGKRRGGNFKRSEDTGKGWRQARELTIAMAVERLEAEVDRLGGRYAVLSTNVETRIDGRPRSDRSAPSDPGVALYFTMGGEPYTMACDTYSSVAQNIAALAAHIAATRAITRYGVATAAETLQAFAALPPPTSGPAPTGEARWWRVLNITPADHPPDLGPADVARLVINGCYRKEAKAVLANGLGDTALARLNIARDEGLATLAQEEIA